MDDCASCGERTTARLPHGIFSGPYASRPCASSRQSSVNMSKLTIITMMRQWPTDHGLQQCLAYQLSLFLRRSQPPSDKLRASPSPKTIAKFNESPDPSKPTAASLKSAFLVQIHGPNIVRSLRLLVYENIAQNPQGPVCYNMTVFQRQRVACGVPPFSGALPPSAPFSLPQFLLLLYSQSLRPDYTA